MEGSQTQLEKILVGLAVEKTLLHRGIDVFDRVEKSLQEKYNCSMMDAYYHPQYLKDTLSEVCGQSSGEIIGSIGQFLMNFRYESPIEEFVQKIIV